MSSTNLVNGRRGPLEDWSQISWRQVYLAVRNLRKRIFLASQLGNRRQLRNLQKLMLRSRANLLLSVRRITQTNQGKATAGIDREIVNTPEQWAKLVNDWKGGNQNPTRRVMIPKPNGKKRPQLLLRRCANGIPTVRDRIEQAVVLNARLTRMGSCV